MYNWSDFNKEHPIRRTIISEWQSLLSEPNNKEEIYHQFLAEHAGLFFGDPSNCLSCISRLDLGADFETDFIRPKDDGSHGFVYEFIEIESPHSRAFTKSRQPSKRLITSIQQISNWRDWIVQNQNISRKLFPSNSYLLFGKLRSEYTIIIDRRSELDINDELRLQQEEAHKVSIRSFDYLTDLLKKRICMDESLLASSEEKALSAELRNALANPFFKAMTGQAWRKLVSSPKFQTAHMYIVNANEFIEAQTYNKHLNAFLSFLSAANPSACTKA